jgi:hypothetical protein
MLRQRVCFFSPEFYRDGTKIQGFQFQIQECFFFTRIFPLWDQNSGFSISHTRGCFFFTRILPRQDQNSGFSISHTCVCFFFIRILLRRDQNSGFSISHTGVKKKHTWLLAVLTIRPRLAFCHRQPRGYRRCRAPYMLQLINESF